MNKKEVLEIRRQFSPDNCAITRICGCYVDHEKEKKMEFKRPSCPFRKRKPSSISTFFDTPCPGPWAKI